MFWLRSELKISIYAVYSCEKDRFSVLTLIIIPKFIMLSDVIFLNLE